MAKDKNTLAEVPTYMWIRNSRIQVQRLVFALSLLIPAMGFIFALVISFRVGFSWVEPITLIVMWIITGIGIEAGYHRLFAHSSYKTIPWIRGLIAIAGHTAFQGPVLYWVANHRLHHSNSDQHLDPHSPHHHPKGRFMGFIHAHIGWFFNQMRPSPGRFARDLLQDKQLMSINRLSPLWLGLGLALPAAIGGLGSWSIQGALIGFLWGGLARVFLTQHFTYCINSVCHLFGTKPFKSGGHAGNVWWMVLPTCGAGLHNNHHAFPNCATYDYRWWQLDPSAWFIRLLENLGLAWDLKRPPDEKIKEQLT